MNLGFHRLVPDRRKDPSLFEKCTPDAVIVVMHAIDRNIDAAMVGKEMENSHVSDHTISVSEVKNILLSVAKSFSLD